MPATKIIPFLEQVVTITRRGFFEEWIKHKKNDRNDQLFVFISHKFDKVDISDESSRGLKKKISYYSNMLEDKWSSTKKTKGQFVEKQKGWFDGSDLQFRVCTKEPTPSTSSGALHPVGRPRISFEDASLKTKKRRVEALVHSRSANELLTAAECASRREGHRNLATQLKNVREGIVEVTPSEGARPLSAEEALAYYVDSKSTTHSYKQTRKWAMRAGSYVFPSYHSVSKAKLDCLPSKDDITVTESRADLNVQAIIDLTTQRIVQIQRTVISTLVLDLAASDLSFTLVSKWGCDGSSGHSTYKQKFYDANATDEFLFVFSFVPLRLLKGDIVVWQNPRPSSTIYCRPLKFIFAKETKELTIKETNDMVEEIKGLLPTSCNLNDVKISVQHEMLLTMTDGKICNALTDTTSAQRCYICGATPKTMNDESKEFPHNPDKLGFGLSTLHAWIRTFECLLHISYRLEIRKWQVRGDSDKAKLKERSESIRQVFKSRMGLIVDKPKPGYGNSNDGNTARRFFSDPELSSEITGLDVDLIKKFHIILCTLASGYNINCDKFEKVCIETRKWYLSLYSWYPMPATVHKILVHSTAVIRSCLLPIGMLSEEAQEARNKDCRKFREHHTRKSSRIATNTDLLNMLLITSDPVINSLREVPRKKLVKLPTEVLDLIIPPSLPPNRIPNTQYLNNDKGDYLVTDSSEIDYDSESFSDDC